MEELYDNMYNRYTNLDGVEWRVLEALMSSEAKGDVIAQQTFKNGENLWKMLKYPTQDCLIKPNLTKEEKKALIYTGVGEASEKRVFLSPFVDDAWSEQASRLNVFVSGVYPVSHIVSQVNVTVEVIVHNKINNIWGEGSIEDPTSNPSEYTKEGDVLIPLKSRATAMLKSVLSMLNGRYIAAVGTLQHNSKTNVLSKSNFQVWNNRAYFGFSATFTTLMSGVSVSAGIGY